MIEFKTNVRNFLPYDRKIYLSFLYETSDLPNDWLGISFQFPDQKGGQTVELINYIRVFQKLFEKVIAKLDSSSFWIVNHEDKDLDWFPNNDATLIRLRTLFEEQNVTNTFRGALLFTKDELLDFAQDLISYPYSIFKKENIFYKDLNISHSELQFVIKISGHLNIDLLSTNKQLLIEVIASVQDSELIVKAYSGTIL